MTCSRGRWGAQVLAAQLTAEELLARLEMTSLAFILDWVPEPVCQTANEVIVELSSDDLRGRFDDGLAAGIQLTLRHVDLRTAL